MLPAHGGKLINRYPKSDSLRKDLEKKSKELPQIPLDEGEVKDLLNIASGAYSPLKGFMGRNGLLKVAQDKTLEDGTVWTVPVTLALEKEKAEEIRGKEQLTLVDEGGRKLAVMDLREIYEPDKEELCSDLFGTADPNHPGVASFLDKGELFAGGPIRLLEEPPSIFSNYRLRPIETRVLFQQKGWESVVGFQTRNVPHRGHEHLQKSALELVDGILIHPKIGRKKSGDWQDEIIIKAYEVLLDHYYLKDHAALSIFTAQMRYMGPREAVFDAIVRKNFGCTHFIVGRDHAGVGDYYGEFEAHEIFDELSDIGIQPLKFDYAYYCKKCGEMVTDKTCPHSMEDRVAPSGTTIRSMVESGKRPPAEMMRPEVVDLILKEGELFVS